MLLSTWTYLIPASVCLFFIVATYIWNTFPAFAWFFQHPGQDAHPSKEVFPDKLKISLNTDNKDRQNYDKYSNIPFTLNHKNLSGLAF